MLEAALARLREKGASIAVCTIGNPLELASRTVLEELAGSPLDGPRFAMYRAMDGVTLAWQLVDPVLGPMGGGLCIPDALTAALRGGATEESEPQEGILWHCDEPPELVAQLRGMTIINSVPGRNEYVTVLETQKPDQAFWLQDGVLQPLVPNLSICLAYLIRYAGADGLLNHLSIPDWEVRVDRDPRLTWLIKD